MGTCECTRNLTHTRSVTTNSYFGRTRNLVWQIPKAKEELKSERRRNPIGEVHRINVTYRFLIIVREGTPS